MRYDKKCIIYMCDSSVLMLQILSLRPVPQHALSTYTVHIILEVRVTSVAATLATSVATPSMATGWFIQVHIVILVQLFQELDRPVGYPVNRIYVPLYSARD